MPMPWRNCSLRAPIRIPHLRHPACSQLRGVRVT
jgi:hypothetical protein